MGYAIMIGSCAACGRVFSFNPVRVPSIRVDGVRQPLCRDCVERANQIRKERGLEPFEIPADAYDPVPEYELEY